MRPKTLRYSVRFEGPPEDDEGAWVRRIFNRSARQLGVKLSNPWRDLEAERASPPSAFYSEFRVYTAEVVEGPARA